MSFYTSSETLIELFEEFGDVLDCYLPEDPVTGNSRGFGFISMENENALDAIDGLDGCELDGRIITVNEAKPRGSTPPPSNDDDDDEDDEDNFEP